jgi:hypothetical protein
VVQVGDQGMLTPHQIDKLQQHPGLGWITALKSGAIRAASMRDGIVLRTGNLPDLSRVASRRKRRVAVTHDTIQAFHYKLRK